MEEQIVNIVQNLMSGILALIGLIFASLGIILNIRDNWKIKRLRKSHEFEKLVSMNVCCVVVVILLLSCSFAIILCREFFWIILAIYIVLLFVLILLVSIAIKYKKLIMLSSDETKPELSIEKDSCDDF